MKIDERRIVCGDMWQRLPMIVLDSVQPGNGARWARDVGFKEAWEQCPSAPLSSQKL